MSLNNSAAASSRRCFTCPIFAAYRSPPCAALAENRTVTAASAIIPDTVPLPPHPQKQRKDHHGNLRHPSRTAQDTTRVAGLSSLSSAGAQLLEVNEKICRARPVEEDLTPLKNKTAAMPQQEIARGVEHLLPLIFSERGQTGVWIWKRSRSSRPWNPRAATANRSPGVDPETGSGLPCLFAHKRKIFSYRREIPCCSVDEEVLPIRNAVLQRPNLASRSYCKQDT